MSRRGMHAPTLRLRKYSRIGSATASSSTPEASTSRSVLMVLTYCTMMSVVAAPETTRSCDSPVP